MSMEWVAAAARAIAGLALLAAVGCGSAAGTAVPPTSLPTPAATETPAPNLALQAATPAFATVTAAQSQAELHMQRLRADLDRGDFAGVSRESQAISGYLQQMTDVQATLDSVASLQATAVPGSESPPPLIAPAFVQESQALAAMVDATVAAHQAGATATSAERPTPSPTPLPPTPTAAAHLAPARPAPTPRVTALAPSPTPPAQPTASPTALAPSATPTPLAAISLPVGIAPLARSVEPGQTLVIHAASFAQVPCRMDAELPDRTPVAVPNAEKLTDDRGAVVWWWPVPQSAAQSAVTLTVRCQKGDAAGRRSATVRVGG